MLRKLKDIKIGKALKNNKRVHQFINLEDIKDILIFMDSSDLIESIFIVQDLIKRGKNVHIWSMSMDNDKELKKASIKNLRVITKEDISSLSILKSEVVKEFKKLNYDTLIDLRKKHCMEFDYLLAINKAKFSIGITDGNYNFYDFLIIQKQNMKAFDSYEEIKKYLKRIK